MVRWLWTVALLAACGGRTMTIDEVVPQDAGPTPVPRCDVDLLFVVDDSASMEQEQAILADALPDTLAAFRDAAHAPRSVQIGVVTTDLGAGGVTLPTCETASGRDGVLQTVGADLVGCLRAYPPFLRFLPGAPSSSPDATGQDLRCLTTRGTGGCGFEQPFEAALKALTPSTSATTFMMGTRGQGDGANYGFLRDGSILAIVVLSDEDDCSAAEPGLFEPGNPAYSSSLNLRCGLHPAALHPIRRYADGFRALRPERLVFAAIVGVPVDLVADHDAAEYDRVLDDPRMLVSVDPDDDNVLAPACNDETRGRATPGRRMTELARSLGDAGLLGSVCQDDLRAPLAAMVERIERIASRGCE